MTSGSDALRIGCVKYLNARPLIYGWPGEVDFDHPSALCRKLANGELGVALVSSIQYLADPIYTVVDDVAVVSEGPVESVFLAHVGALDDVDEIILDPASRAAETLLRCLLAITRMRVRFLAPSDYTPMTRTRAQLLIGDQALRFRAEHAGEYEFRDLAEWWRELTGLPFVFALWLIRPEIEDAHALADRLRARRDANMRALDQLIAAENEFTPEFCQHYFRDCLRFSFGEREKEGLNTFRELCERHRILQPNETPLRLA